mmetsp:Transcript_32363/g.48831  ORF Transcript_32363/g.48831 Transcript_32363/m.48831 type:complete len:117 (+) Transcript_32363:127-477(+)|eukprot:CAMPEP_0194765524 /NCGR_PEP_ID=MMETSP0323_2-20130528/26864_1 /TAXON_ID=2866 ORGANISM="Crypthecodinium cohnii, Strain Seligo" /NCGR_SAMPLE_ID=MMETSP0323_2 /ASSEMBLY_ACC=CAM_ASM_000346 /LENGTH=116 /DNA_ID=CAMNT_0039695245 /DNA_START=96 /DNA_END=446 /DNA_ORIENTATION=-
MAGPPGKVRCSHLLIKNENSRNPVSRRTNQATSGTTEKAAMEELLEIKAKITPENFAQMAQERSDCGSYRSGGDLGWFGEGEMMQAFWDGTNALKVGEIGDPVKTDSGLHLILRTG